MFQIVCDTCADVTVDWAEDHGVTLVAHRIRSRAGDKGDVVEVHPADTYVGLATDREVPRISQPSPAEFQDVLGHLAARGATQVAVLCVSSGLSSTYENAIAAARGFRDAMDIAVIDSRNVSAGEAILLSELVAARQMGFSFADAVEHTRSLVRHVTIMGVLPPGAPILKSGGPLGKIRGALRSVLSRYALATLDGQGRCVMVDQGANQKHLAGRIARLMAVDSVREGPLSYREISVGYPRFLSILEKYIELAGFSSTAQPVVNGCGALACRCGLGAFGIAYVASDRLIAVEDVVGGVDDVVDAIHDDGEISA